jgi:phosphoribosylanthranilate isomerase
MTKLKVCGMRTKENIQSLLEVQPDYVGFIFYEKSPRFVGEELDAGLLHSFPRSIKKVGVFVNAHPDFILKNVKKYGLDMVQLHGNETPEFCKGLRSRGLSIIKAFSIDKEFNFARLNNYKNFCDYFLFDTKGESYGGTGKAFDWEMLKSYDNEKPFFLSGGISPDHTGMISELKAMNIHSVDINSLFEKEPGLKDVEMVKTFAKQLRQAIEMPQT